MKYLLNKKAVKELAKFQGKRVSKDFMDQLNAHVERKVIAACNEHNGGKKTLDIALASYLLTGHNLPLFARKTK